MTLKEKRANPLYTKALLLTGNNKLLDFDDPETGKSYRYAQVNTRPIKDCPFRSAGCTAVCYATKGNHRMPSVKDSREKSFIETQRKDFSEAIIYTIETEIESARYKGKVMIVRIHESGDFYSLQYLKKWVKAWSHFQDDNRIIFCFYTKSFPFFNMLTDAEKAIINAGLENGRLAISASLDDTTTSEQFKAWLEFKRNYPLTNVYQCTENVVTVKHDDVCDCANCAKCGKCTHTTGKTVVVKIHSASKADMTVYRDNATERGA